MPKYKKNNLFIPSSSKTLVNLKRLNFNKSSKIQKFTWCIVRTFEPTAVPKEFATSFAPTAKARIKAKIKAKTAIQRVWASHSSLADIASSDAAVKRAKTAPIIRNLRVESDRLINTGFSPKEKNEI